MIFDSTNSRQCLQTGAESGFLFVKIDLVKRLVEYAARSVHEMRTRLTQDLARVDRAGPLGQSLLAMRAACRKFLDEVQGMEDEMPLRRFPFLDDLGGMVFGSALGELRGVFGVHQPSVTF